jgi:hypothetical protein
MKFFLSLVILAAVFGAPHSAFADSADFKTGVFDPPTNPDPILPLTDIQTTTPFSVVFGGCPATIGNPPVPIVASGCFLGLNDTGQTITSLDLTFDNTTSADPNDPNALNGQDADCETTSVFVGSSSNCGLVNGSTYNLLFSGAVGLPPGAFFVITESGPNPDAFQGGEGVITITPEPNSYILLLTGMMMAGMFLFRRSLSASR